MIRTTIATSALILLTACGGGSSDSPKTDPAETPSSAPTTQKRFPVDPDSDEAKAYIAGLSAVQDGLGMPRALNWGRSTCGDIESGAPVERNIKLRYAGGDRPPLSQKQVTQIKGLVTTYICPDLA